MGNALNWFTKPIACRRWTLFTLLLASICLFTTPVTAGSGNPAQAMAPRSGVLIPLYIYPVRGAWDPLYAVIQSHPSLDFTIVINPASGPGAAPLPDANYTREIPRLNSYSNVRTVGYVAIDYGRRSIDAAYSDIAQYATWSQKNPKLAMQGIFLDESPQLADDHNTTFLADVKSRIRSTNGLASGSIVMNPGSIPESRILGTTDRTVVFEEQYQTYINRQAAKSLAALPDREMLVCLMHSIPSSMEMPQLKTLVAELRELAGSLFLTDLSENYYNRFSPRFKDFIDAMI